MNAENTNKNQSKICFDLFRSLLMYSFLYGQEKIALPRQITGL